MMRRYGCGWQMINNAATAIRRYDTAATTAMITQRRYQSLSLSSASTLIAPPPLPACFPPPGAQAASRLASGAGFHSASPLFHRHRFASGFACFFTGRPGGRRAGAGARASSPAPAAGQPPSASAWRLLGAARAGRHGRSARRFRPAPPPPPPPLPPSGPGAGAGWRRPAFHLPACSAPGAIAQRDINFQSTTR